MKITARIKKFIRERFEPLEVGDEVEFTLKVDIASAYTSWVTGIGGPRLMCGDFKRPGQRFVFRGVVVAVGGLIHVEHNSFMPGYKDRCLYEKTSFSCERMWLKKVLR